MRNRLAFTLLAIPLMAAAQSTCPDFDSSIEASLKALAMSNVEGIGDNSAPRQTLRNIEIGNHLQQININLTLQIQNKCPVRKAPVSPAIYLSEAIECKLAQAKGERESPACDMKSWKGLKK